MRRYLLAISLLASSSFFIRTVSASFFYEPPPTLSGQLESADGAYLARIVSKGEFIIQDSEGSDLPVHTTTFELVDVLKPGLIDVDLRMHITLDYEHSGRRGDLVVLFGSRGIFQEEEEDFSVDESDAEPADALVAIEFGDVSAINWHSSEPLTWAGYDYVKGLLQDEMVSLPSDQRLRYFLPFLEHEDEVIADDAFEELERAEFSDLASIAQFLPRDRLLHWVRTPDEDTNLYRRGHYGMLLGLCGTPRDARELEQILLAPPTDEEREIGRIGYSGLIMGYLLLTRDQGLDMLVRKKLVAAADDDTDEFYFVFEALQQLQEIGAPAVSRRKLQSVMWTLLERRTHSSEAIHLLARVADWSAQDRLIELWDGCHEDGEIRDAIYSYLCASALRQSDPACRATAEQARNQLKRWNLELPSEMPDDEFVITEF